MDTTDRSRKLSKTFSKTKVPQLSTRPSIQKTESNTSLQHHPSAPIYPRAHTFSGSETHQRTQSITLASSNSSLDQQNTAASADLVVAGYASASSSTLPHPVHHQSSARQRHPNERSADDLIGAPFDATGILSTVNSAQRSDRSGGHSALSRRPPPPPLAHTHTSPDPCGFHLLRQSQSFYIADRSAMEITPPRSDTGTMSPKRYSDEVGGGKPPASLRKKSGFSSFVNSMLGSPRPIKISAPENPVHMIHVGFDNLTGQYTVSEKLRYSGTNRVGFVLDMLSPYVLS